MTPRNSPLRSGADFEIVSEELTPEDVHRATFGDVSRGGLIPEAAKGLRRYLDGRSTGDFAVRALEAEQAGDQAAFERLMAERATRLASSAPDAPRVAGVTDVRGLRDAVDWAGSTLGEGLPSLGPSITGAIIGRRLLGGALGKAPAAAIGGAFPAYHDIHAGEVDAQYSDPALAAASADDRARTARQTAGLGTALEVLLPTRLVGGLGRGTRVGRALTGDALTEAVTEGGQSAISQFGNMGLDPGREFSYKELVDSAAAGGLVGGAAGARTSTVQGAVSAIDGLRARAADSLRRDPQPGADAAPPDAAPPGTPLLPAPDDGGGGGGVGGLYDTLNERFGDGIRDRAQKTKDYVSDTLDRMGEAAKTAETPQDFLRQVFGNSTEDAAAADLRPDTEDPDVLNAADPAAALQQRDAQRQERAALFAAELLNDPATPESVKERVASFGGDFTNPEAQAFVARNLVAQRAGEKLANAVSDLFDLTKDFGGKAAETGTDLASKARDMIDKSMSAATDRIVKKNLQGINEADVAPLVRLLAQRLGPALAGDAPKLARQLVAAANRLSPDARITEETDRRLRNFSTAVDDEVLDLVTELSGSDALRNTIAKIRSIPSAASDVRQSGGYSFLESMLKQPLEPAVLSQLSEFVDTLGLQLGSMPSERKNQVLAGLALAFGSKREAQTVVEYYGNIRRDAFRLEAEADTLADDRPLDDDAPGEVVATLENPDGTVSYGAEFGSLTEQDAAEMTASYRDPNPARPFFRATDRAALRDARRAAPPGSRAATLREYVAQTGENPKAVAARVRQDLRKRLTDAENRDTATVQEAIASMEAVPEAERSEDFNALLSQLKSRKTENRTDLPGLRKQMAAIEKASGVSFKEIADLNRRIRRAELADEGGVDNDDVARLPELRKQLAKLEDRYAKNAERVLERYAVVMRPKDETFANDELMAKFRGLLDKLPNANVGTPAERAKKREAIARIKKTAIKFYRKGRKTPITLSAESMAYASQARGSMEERFLDSLAAVLARPDIEGMVTPAADTLISRQSGLTWGDIAPEQLEDTRSEAQKQRARKAAQEKAAIRDWAKQTNAKADFENRAGLMKALRDLQRQFLADRLGLTTSPNETLSLTDLIDRFPANQRRTMRTAANELAFNMAVGWAQQLDRKLATAKERNYRDESRMRVLEAYVDEQVKDRHPMPDGDERPSSRASAEEVAAGMYADETGVGGQVADLEAELSVLEDRIDAVAGIRGLEAKYERMVDAVERNIDELTDSVPSAEQRDFRVPGPRTEKTLEQRGDEAAAGAFGRRIRKKSFVGAKADPEGAGKAGSALGEGADAEMVWALHGWFRGPDGKMRKEIRSPVLRTRVRSLAEYLIDAPPGEQIVSARKLFEGVPGFERLLDDLDEFGIFMSDATMLLGSSIGSVRERVLFVSVDAAAGTALLDTVPVDTLISLSEEGVLPSSPSSPDLFAAARKAASEGKLPGFSSAEAFDAAAVTEMEKTIHHELQHILQEIEGFENGGNSRMAIVSKYGDIDALSDALDRGDSREAEEITERAREAMLADIGHDADPDEVAYGLYRDLIGEVEAYDVEKRFDLSAEEARRIYPDLMSPNKEFLRAVRTEINAAKLRAGLKRASAPQRAPKTSQEKTVKKSFVGAKSDPQGARDAEKLLGIGAPADVVWRDLGWFRGPDGKLRKEIRSPVLRRRVRDFAAAVANGSRKAIEARDLLAGVDAFKPYLDKLGDLPINPNDSTVELMGAIGVYIGEEGVANRGIGLSRVNAELAVRINAVPNDKGMDLLHAIADSLLPVELEGTGLDFVDLRDVNAEFEARYPMPDVKERVAEMLAGTILHELQHAFQHVEGFENGGNATTAVIAKYGDPNEYVAATRDGDYETAQRITEQAFAQFRAEVGPDGDMEAAAHELYESIVGEVEANDVAARMNLSDEEAASVKPALMDAEREFVRSVLLAEALSTLRSRVNSSKVRARRGRPGKDWGDKEAVKAEILRLRGKDVKVAVEKLVKQLGGSGQYTYDPATGERLIEVAINARSPVGTARHEALHDLFRFLSENEATRSIARDLRDATSAPHVIRQLRDLLKNDKAALEQLSDPEERAAYAYQFWAEGLLQIGPTGTGVFGTIRQFIKDLFGVVTAGQRGEDLLRAFHDGKFADPSTVQEVLQDINDSSGDRVANKLNRAAPALTHALNSLVSAAPERLRRFENDYLNELADKFQPEKGTGFVQNRFQQEGVWTNRLGGILRGTTAVERREAIDQLQAMKPTSKLAKELAKFNEDIYEYMRDAGVQSWDSTSKKFVPLRKVQGYFTRSWDPDAIARNRSEFEALLRTEGGVSATNAAALAENLVRGSEQRPKPKESPVDLGFMPYAPHTSERVLTFINSGNVDKFAKFQRKDLADIMMSYVRGATHRAEYAREFGNNGEKIAELVTESGIKDAKELREISNAVQAMEGSLDPGNWSVQTKEAMSALQTMQNVTLLPLAIVSQMIDPIVLAARTGDIKDAGTAYVTALKRLKNTIAKSKNKVPGEELAEILGVVSEDSTLQAMSMAYGTTRMSKRMENINRVFFKYNGMQGWNNSMRIAATAAGEKYLLAHRKDAKALAELGLEPKDIKSVGGKLDVSSPKVQQAMFQFVDQAVLRPTAANRPVWMSDPRFLLVAHLKQFSFAMQNVVLKRANRELQNDNPKPWGILMMAAPVILAADVAKFALTGRAPTGWGFKDYVLHAVERSGLLGIGDFGFQAMDRVDSGKMPGEGLLGPTFENLMEILRWIGGDPRTDFKDVVDRTVPGARYI